jgi:DNA processing protein
MGKIQHDDTFYKIWLSKIHINKKDKITELLLYYKDYEACWNADYCQLINTGILNMKEVQILIDSKKDTQLILKENDRLKELDGQIIGILDGGYPKNLREIHSPPPFLYIRGNLECLNKICIAMVGSRKASNYGLGVAKNLARQLSAKSITVVSGLAYGIDSQAHWSVIENNGHTIAVLGSGIDVVYPPSNRELYNRILENKGCIISEFCLSTPPMQHNFIYRNRIISGLSLGVIVVEAGLKSGSLITANYALEQGREVFAVPGNIVNYNSQGTNQLIRSGAKMVSDIADVLEEIQYHYPIRAVEMEEKKLSNRNIELLSEEEKEIYLALKLSPLCVEELVEKASLDVSQLYSKLTLMELQGIIELKLGKYFLL